MGRWKMERVDDIKVFLAGIAGIGNWAIQIDLILKIGISAVSLIYIKEGAEGTDGTLENGEG